MIIHHSTVKRLKTKYNVDINQFYKDTYMHNQKMFLVKEYKNKVLVKTSLDIKPSDFVPENKANIEYHLTVPTNLVLEYLLEMGIEFTLETKSLGKQDNYNIYSIEISSSEIVIPDQSEFAVLPSLNLAVETFLLILLEREILTVNKGIIILEGNK